LQQLEALGLNVPSVLRQLGINGAATAPPPTEPPSIPSKGPERR
jgi:hypothetical protein